ncbi:MAG: amino acid adenylation domain-containing protein, partial [Ignavibacteriaceae bacterium]|nr:amino acid adenylation domain-containing protein [Ignavibacteriaceae bacterium]
KYEPNTPVYNIPMAYRIRGEFDFSTFGKAVNAVIGRHEILRTRFKMERGTPYQDILGELKLDIPLIDLSEVPSQEREVILSEQLHSKARNTFNISEGPLLNCVVFKLEQLDYVVLFVIHHIIFDGWSINVLLKELAQYYLSHLQGDTVSLHELPIQYADFSLWQRQWLKGDVLKHQLDYWKNQLRGELPPLELPTDFPRPAIQKYDGNTELFTIDQELAETLSTLGRQENSTLFMVLLTALYILIYRYSGQKDICVGTVIANRIRPELDELMGVFVNNLVMRSNLSNNQSFRELLRSVRRICLEAYEHQDLPFEKLVEELQPKRDLSRTPLFQILFSYQENGEDTFLLNSIKLQQVPVHSGVARTDLSLWIENTDGELNCALEYSTHLFQPVTVRRFLKNYICLLEEICENADQKVSEIQILHKEAQNKVLNEWNDTKGAFPDDSTVIGLFEEQAKQSANKVAVESGGEKLSYSRLNERTNQVANYLTSIGVKAGDYVGICIDRSVEMLISMLAVLKSGAAYVPMDPIFPAERLEYMIDDAEVKVIITTSQLTDIFSGFNGQRILIDREWEKIKLQGNQSPDIKVRPDNLAYVIFTSGSTGKPKGVQIGHRSVVNFLLSMQNEPGIRSDDVLLSVTTISFDISVLELFLPLISGARLIIAPRSTTSDGKLLIKALKDSKATIMQGTPSTWKMMIEAGWRSAPDLKMLCGGEALPIELAKQMLARGESLWNMYGPTETTVWSAVKKIEPEDDAVYIGPPIANTQFYILDNELNPVPIGVPGELLIGGEGLARGYLNRPELTDEKFISNPFGESGSRLYRTGDLARYKSNGDIEFLGRLDHQVKIRGFRIELGEIENVLSEHTAIKDVAVNAWSDASGDKKLVAYYISESGETIQVSDFREFLRHKLPDYMIPSFFVRMDEFPLTPNKKIDRKALPAPDVSEVSTAEKYVPPRDELERELASIWQKILGVKAIGINDNFFDLGGHSLLAAQLFAQIEKRMGKNLPLALLFQAPTIAQLAEAVRNKDWENNRRATTPIEKVDRPEYLPLSFSQQRL